jgi:hypothetical protein
MILITRTELVASQIKNLFPKFIPHQNLWDKLDSYSCVFSMAGAQESGVTLWRKNEVHWGEKRGEQF